MPAWLAPAIIGAISTAGEALTGWQNKKEAEKNRAFQERMSSTAIQRSVADYKAAGLNPGLAYERSASSPGGAQAQIGNAIEKGVSSAQAYRVTRQQMRLAQDRMSNENLLIREQAGAAKAANMSGVASAQKAWMEANAIDQTMRFQKALQPGVERMQEAQNLLTLYALPGAKNTAAFENMLGTFKPGVSNALNWGRALSEIMKTIKR